MDHGEAVVPEMESWLKEVHGLPAERHLLDILNRLKQGHSHVEFLEFCTRAAQSKDFDLEDACFLLASTEYAATDMSRYHTMIDDIASEVRLQMDREGNPSEIRALSFVLHEKMRFRGNRDRYYEAENTYLNRVLERKVGVPITLSLLYLILGEHLNMHIHGIALPGHFIVGWHGQFFDPFNHGRLLNEEACKQMVESRGHEFHPDQLNPAIPHQILIRMLMNLARVYEIEEDRARLARIRKYLQTLSGQ